jgi:hypothetical protein
MPGYRHEWYRTEGEEAVRVDGEVVERATFEPTEPTPLNLFHAAVAYVGDYSFFGFTSPADGHRYRFEIEPGIGTLSYVSVLADVRRYVFVRPVTVAFRAFHYGRYLGDAESERLSELFLGFPDWVRGYGYRSLEPGRCGDEDCDRFERLFGSRVAVTNAELRIPLLGTRDYGILDFRYLPTSVVAFFDAGVAWRKGVRPDWVIGDSAQGRIPVMSAGGAIRLNLLGVVVLQGYVAHAFQRIGDKWQFGLILAPGW